MITNRIFDPIGYDCRGIRLKVFDPVMQNRMEQSEAEEALAEAPDEDESEDEGFYHTM